MVFVKKHTQAEKNSGFLGGGVLGFRLRRRWFYLFVLEARSPHGKATPMGRIIMRRGNYYDEIPVWLSSESPVELWKKLRERRMLPEPYAREFAAAVLGNEEALHDFWSTVGFNPVGYVVGLGRKVPGMNRSGSGRSVQQDAPALTRMQGTLG